jgi:FkbM family methyltransferase
VGQDISFDLALILQFGCHVQAFDPTPRCISWLGNQKLPNTFHFHPIGLSDKIQTLRFAAPPEGNFVSYTVASRSDSTEFVELPVKPLDVIMLDIGHSSIDLLKMDIEGSEYVVIADMVAKGIFPKQLCIEFHHGMFGYEKKQTQTAVNALRKAGYRIHHVSASGREYGFHINSAERSDG